MITIEQRDRLINAAVFGEFTLDDFRRFEEAVQVNVQRDGGRVSLLLDLRDMTGATIDVAWEEIKFSRKHPHDFARIGLVTDDQWVAWSTWLNGAFVDADIQVFDNYDDAMAWVKEPQE